MNNVSKNLMVVAIVIKSALKQLNKTIHISIWRWYLKLYLYEVATKVSPLLLPSYGCKWFSYVDSIVYVWRSSYYQQQLKREIDK